MNTRRTGKQCTASKKGDSGANNNNNNNNNSINEARDDRNAAAAKRWSGWMAVLPGRTSKGERKRSETKARMECHHSGPAPKVGRRNKWQRLDEGRKSAETPRKRSLFMDIYLCDY